MLSLVSQEDSTNETIVEEDQINTINKLLGLQPQPLEFIEKDDISYRIQRLEKLLDRRPLLLNNCLLRQNKHNLKEWMKV